VRRAALALPSTILLLSTLAIARADVVCLPGDFSPSGSDSYPGSVQRYQGSAPGIQENGSSP
jgi:hypothetical protein